jgi:hypothetical protein
MACVLQLTACCRTDWSSVGQSYVAVGSYEVTCSRSRKCCASPDPAAQPQHVGVPQALELQDVSHTWLCAFRQSHT